MTPSLSAESFERRQVIRRNQQREAIGKLDNVSDILQYGLIRLKGEVSRWYSAAIFEIIAETARLEQQQPAAPQQQPAAPQQQPAAPVPVAPASPNPDPPAEFPKEPSVSDGEDTRPEPRAFRSLKRAHTCIDLTEE